MNTPVKFEVAKLLKEKEYDKPLYSVYSTEFNPPLLTKRVSSLEGKLVDSDILAPTIAEVVMWLYEKHGIWISVNEVLLKFEFRVNNQELYTYYNTPTEAYEAAFEYTLTNLI